MRIGVLGGTFDPPHKGHLALAKAAIAGLDLEEVILMPAARNPIKGRRVVTPAEHRLGMIEALIRSADDPRLAFSDLEITRGGPSYTVDTMSELQMVRPADYWFIVGADSLRTLSDWKQPQRLLKLCRLAVAVRPPVGSAELAKRVPPEFRERVDVIEMEPHDISSTDLRDRISRNQNVTPWIPVEVLRYIHSHRLYQT